MNAIETFNANATSGHATYDMPKNQYGYEWRQSNLTPFPYLGNLNHEQIDS